MQIIIKNITRFSLLIFVFFSSQIAMHEVVIGWQTSSWTKKQQNKHVIVSLNTIMVCEYLDSKVNNPVKHPLIRQLGSLFIIGTLLFLTSFVWS
jgi:hypothetical protein